jgi:hypothetical protein
LILAAWVALTVAQFPPAERNRSLEGDCLFLRTRSFSWTMDSAGLAEIPGDTEFQAVDRALSTWKTSLAPCSDLDLRPSARVPDAGTLPGRNTLLFRTAECSAVVPAGNPCFAADTCSDLFHCWSHGASAIAVPSTTYDTRTGEILRVDLELNVGSFLFTTVDSPVCVSPNFMPTCVATDLETVVLTETGRALGLASVPGGDSTLGNTLAPGQLRRTVDSESRAGLCGIYRAGLPTTSCDGGMVKPPFDAGVPRDAGTPGDGGVACGPSNCQGCCSAAGVCQSGNDHSACGAGGNLCGMCINLPRHGCGCSSGLGGLSMLGVLALLAARRRAQC